MKKFLETIRNIWKIEELRSRILYTLGILLIYRLGTHVVIPGIDPDRLANLQQPSGNIMDIINLFTGGAFARASIFGLGIMPYISATIVIQLLGIAVPYFQRLQREGESGRRKINQISRYLTVAILLLQAPTYITSLRYQLPADAFSPNFSLVGAVIMLTAGCMFVLWLGERITDKGIGNGVSLIIMIGIIARLPQAIGLEFGSRLDQQGGGLVAFLVEILIMFAVFMLSILLVQGTRRIPVQYAKRIVGNKQYGGVRQYIPLKVNAAGVMPIIFAQALMFIPITVAGFAKSDSATGIAAAFSNPTGFWYNFVNATLIILFTYFYTAVTVNPTQMAEDMKKNGGFIPGVKPGRKTAEFLDSVMSKITLPGSFFLAFVAIMPAFAMMFGIDQSFAMFFGGTSLLIMVGVILDTLQQVESHLLMRHYDGLMKSGKIKGRAGGTASGI
ncbi:MAG: preprotein translocase subunit SecY [Bacteroidales bacterium]|jgi:preprotein translocase subunit SecY|nr:preprotein translocase subunit SecY [Bacteroidales bacterium]